MPEPRIPNPMKNILLSFLAGLGLVTVVVLAIGGFEEPATYHGTHLAPAMPPVDFTLTSAEGPVSRSDLEGKVAPIFFGFTSCPDICPATLHLLSRALEQLGEGREDVQVVFVSVDPERDTPARTSAYAESVDPSFLGVTGSRAEIAEVASAYGIHHAKMEAGDSDGYMMEHTAAVVVLNREGGVELLWSPPVTAAQMAEDLGTLLRH